MTRLIGSARLYTERGRGEGSLSNYRVQAATLDLGPLPLLKERGDFSRFWLSIHSYLHLPKTDDPAQRFPCE